MLVVDDVLACLLLPPDHHDSQHYQDCRKIKSLNVYTQTYGTRQSHAHHMQVTCKPLTDYDGDQGCSHGCDDHNVQLAQWLGARSVTLKGSL